MAVRRENPFLKGKHVEPFGVVSETVRMANGLAQGELWKTYVAPTGVLAASVLKVIDAETAAQWVGELRATIHALDRLASDLARHAGIAAPEPGDLITSEEVAQLMGVTGPRAVSVYRSRPGFPEPVLARGGCVLWNRADIRAWCAANKGRTPERVSAFAAHLERLGEEPAYQHGYVAGLAGEPTRVCPTGPSAPESIDWMDGWRAGHFAFEREVLRTGAWRPGLIPNTPKEIEAALLVAQARLNGLSS